MFGGRFQHFGRGRRVEASHHHQADALRYPRPVRHPQSQQPGPVRGLPAVRVSISTSCGSSRGRWVALTKPCVLSSRVRTVCVWFYRCGRLSF